MCIRLLHTIVMWHVVLQIWKKCTAAIKSVGPYQGVGGTFPRDTGGKPNVSEESYGTCTFLSEIAEKISKMHHSVCSVV